MARRSSKVVRGNIPNMVQGISQQAPALRLSAQSEEDLNVHPLIVDGLTKRPPSRSLCSLSSDFDENTFFHVFVRDDDEKYVLAIETDGTVRVFDFDGNEKTVTDNSNGYLASLTDPGSEIHALTVADYTFITNRSKVVAARSATKAARNPEGIINIKAGNYGKDVTVWVDGVNEASFSAPDGGSSTHSQQIATTYIANQLYAAMTDTGTGTEFDVSPWSIAQYKNVIWISKSTGDFSLEVDDDYSGSLAVGVKDEVVNFSDLPRFNKEGFHVLVKNNNVDEEDDYWVEFIWSQTTGGEGYYKETLKPGAKLGLDADTMPHTLVRNANGTFTFGPAPWEDRAVGDDEVNPDPSFVGETVNSVFFHKNRLGILTGENAVLSESRRFFNFYRQTMTAVLDTDPIDIAASHHKISYLKHAVGFQDVMVLFSDRTQFRLAGDGETLTPLTVAARPLTEMDCVDNVTPVVAQASLFFLSESENYTQLYEYFIDKAVDIAEPVRVSSHVPSLIPKGGRHLVGASHYDSIFVHSTGAPNSVFLYKYYVSDKEKLQSAWVEWQFPNVTRIGDLYMYRSWLVMVMQRDDGMTYLEQVNIEQGQHEKVNLDRRVEVTSGTYDGVTDTTAFTVPYTIPTGYNVVSEGTGSFALGVDLTDKSSKSGTTLTVEGNLSSETLFVGIPYPSRHTFARLYYRDARQNDRVSIQDGRLSINRMDIFHGESAYFQVKVNLDGRAERTYTFTGMNVSQPTTLTGELSLKSGRMSVPVMSRSDRAVITVENNTWRPYVLTSATWRGVFNPSNRQT